MSCEEIRPEINLSMFLKKDCSHTRNIPCSARCLQFEGFFMLVLFSTYLLNYVYVCTNFNRINNLSHFAHFVKQQYSTTNPTLKTAK